MSQATNPVTRIGRGLGKAFAGFVSYMVSLADALNEARTKDPRIAANLW